MELRCEHKLFGFLIDSGVLEVKCNSAFCGHEPGVVVLHRFSTKDGSLIETLRFKDTPKIKEEEHDTSVRNS